MEPKLPVVHVVSGEVASGALRQVLPDDEHGRVVALIDVLNVGPLAAKVERSSWLALRRPYFAAAFDAPPDLDLWLPDAVVDEACTPTLWMGAGTPDHVTLAWLYQALASGAGNHERLRIIQYRVPLAHGESTTIPVIPPERLQRRPSSVNAASLHGYLEGTWKALTAAEPTELETFLGQATPEALPVFREALAERLRQLPSADRGLSAWDHCLLTNVLKFPERLTHAIAHTLADIFERLDFIGDGWLMGRLRRMAEEPSPLVVLAGDPHRLRDCQATLTDTGLAVLEGELNALDVRPCDVIVGGVRADAGPAGVWCRFPDGSVALRPR